jgi:chromosomal replication initiator protein
VITSPTSFHSTNIKKNLEQTLLEAFQVITGRAIQLEYRVGSPSTPNATPVSNSVFSPGPTAQKISESPRVEELFSPQTIQSTLVSQAEFQSKKAGLRTDYVFKTFAVSTTNEMAHAAASAVSQNPGSAYNPLFLYGGVGVGKTHLMHAIGNNIILSNPQAKVLYCTGEEFTNEIVRAIQNKKALQFKEKYRNVQVLLIDDIQFIAGKTAVQEEFFHTFNAVVQQQGQIVLTSDRPPHEISLIEDRLRSRFEAGLMIDIQQPTFELRTAIFLIKSKAHGLSVPMEIAQLIASKVESARKIEGVITSLRSEVELKKKLITRELVESLLNDSQAASPKQNLRVPPTEVIKAVANHYHIKQVVIRGEKRQKEIIRARHMAMFLLKEELKMPYTEIGRWFSNRDHTSAMHACEKIGGMLLKDELLFQELSAIKMSLLPLSK